MLSQEMFRAFRALLPPTGSFIRKPLSWLIFCVLLSSLVLVYPLYVIWPFRYQGARELAVALTVIRFRPVFEVLSMAACLILLGLAWRRSRGYWARASAIISAVLVIGLGLLSRVNIYEIMFHPLDRQSFSPVSHSKLKPAEMVIAVRVSGQARAYPVRSISYHHIVNDVVGGLPIVATY